MNFYKRVGEELSVAPNFVKAHDFELANLVKVHKPNKTKRLCNTN